MDVLLTVGIFVSGFGAFRLRINRGFVRYVLAGVMLAALSGRLVWWSTPGYEESVAGCVGPASA